MTEVQPSLPPVRVASSADAARVFHEHRIDGREESWVELRPANSRFVCPECGLHEGFSARRA